MPLAIWSAVISARTSTSWAKTRARSCSASIAARLARWTANNIGSTPATSAARMVRNNAVDFFI
jgi:hypothetical protein